MTAPKRIADALAKYEAEQIRAEDPSTGGRSAQVHAAGEMGRRVSLVPSRNVVCLEKCRPAEDGRRPALGPGDGPHPLADHPIAIDTRV